jgi:hypothetical protein
LIIIVLFRFTGQAYGKYQQTIDPFIHGVKLHFTIKQNPANMVAGPVSN